jgi:hypothetical protein
MDAEEERTRQEAEKRAWLRELGQAHRAGFHRCLNGGDENEIYY